MQKQLNTPIAEEVHSEPLRHTVQVEAPKPYANLTPDEKLDLAKDTGRVAAHFIAKQKHDISGLNEELEIDNKTGLGNERKLKARLTELTDKEDEKETSSLGLMMFDLDKFKSINDALGHEVADEILNLLGQRLPAILRPTDIPARPEEKIEQDSDVYKPLEASRKHGDEFYIITPDLDDTRNGGSKLTRQERHAVLAQRVEDELVASVNESVYGEMLHERGLEFGLSMGAAIYQPNQGVDSLLKAVDASMYETKRSKDT